MYYSVNVYFSNWHHSWSIMENFDCLYDALKWVNKLSIDNPNDTLCSVSIVRRNMIWKKSN